MLWRALRPDAEPRTEILMPPLAWNLPPDDAQSILTTLATSIHSGLAVPRPLTAVHRREQRRRRRRSTQPLPRRPLGNPRARFDDGVIDEHRQRSPAGSGV